MPGLATILLVEDLPDDCVLLRYALKKTGLANPIHDVSHGRAAIDYLSGVGQYANRETFPIPGLIISGMRVSPVSGIELLQWLKARPDFAHIPIVLLSGLGTKQDIELAYAAGAKLALPKSVNYIAIAHELVKAFSAVLNPKRS